jgi:hypothetical protein
MAEEDIIVQGKTLAADYATIEGEIKHVARDKIGFGSPGAYVDVDASHPLPTTDAAVLAALLAATLPTGASTAAKQDTAQTTLAAIQTALGPLATQTTLAAVLAKLSADPATQTTLAALLSAVQGTLTTAPTTAGDVATTLTAGRKTVASPGTAEALGGSLACKWVRATALKTNTDLVCVGGAATLATLGLETGDPLDAGESSTIPVSNRNLVFVDARVSGQGVQYTVGA